MSIGPTPSGETCQQVGTTTYDHISARAECSRFVAGIRSYFGAEPLGASLHIHSNPHDFGSYLEVCVKYDENSDASSEYAYAIEGRCPETWDELEHGKYVPEVRTRCDGAADCDGRDFDNLGESPDY